MKRMLLFLLLPIMGLMTVACSDSDNGKDDEGTETFSLALSSDRAYFTADGVDKVTFSVKNAAGEDLSAKCIYKANDEELVDNTLSAKTPGTYKVTATYKGVTSNALDVIAMGENVELKVVADKKSIVADGGDFACLYLEDEQGSRIPDGVFYVDGEKLETPYFSTTEAGMFRITANWNGKEAEEALSLGAFAEGEYTARMLVESLTGTNCGYCVDVINILTEGEKLARNDSRVVLVETHYRGQSPEMWQRYDERSRAMQDDFIEYYGSTGTPSVYLDRKKDKFSMKDMGKEAFLASIKSKAEVAIAIKSGWSEDKKNVEVTAVVGSKKSFNGKVVAALVEDGIYLAHTSLGMIEWFHTMRDYQPAFEGGDAVAFSAGAPKEVKVTIPLGNALAENSKVVVFVLNEEGLVENVQQVAAGSSIGY